MSLMMGPSRVTPAAGMSRVNVRRIVGQRDLRFLLDFVKPLQDGSGRGGHLDPLFRYRLPGRDFLAVQQRGK